MKTVQSEAVQYRAILKGIAGPELEVTEYQYGDKLPYAWNVRTSGEPIQHIATIELTPTDILVMNGMRSDQKREHLHIRFAHLFGSKPKKG